MRRMVSILFCVCICILCISSSVHALTFVAYADTRTFPEQHRAMLGQVEDAAPQLIINAGDLADGYRDQFMAMLQSFPTVNTLLAANKYLVAKGSDSHDSESWVKGLQPTVLRDGAIRYAFTEGNCFFVCNGTSADSDTWIQQQLASTEAQNARYRIIYQHSPVYSSGAYLYSGNGNFEQLCDQYDVALVFTGHSHHYERTKVIRGGQAVAQGDNFTTEDGTVYVVTGGGGAELYSMQSSAGWWTAARQQIHHICIIDAAEDALTLTARNDEGVIFDQFVWHRGAATHVSMPAITPTESSFAEQVTVSLSCATAGAHVYYTLDGTEPTQQSTRYTAPFVLSSSTTVKAKAFASGLEPSAVAEQVYSRQGPPELTSIEITPSSVTVQPEHTVQFAATARDQYGDPFDSGTITWSTACPDGVGSIGATTGLFTAGPDNGGPCTVTAERNGIFGTASVTVSTDLVISSISRASYTSALVNVGVPLCYDRSYSFATIPPSLLGLDCIQTAYSGDESNNDSSFLSFTVNMPSVVYVAVCMTNMDGASASAPWLNDGSWNLESYTIGIDHYDSNRSTYAVFSKSFPAAPITLGGNNGVQNMYSVIVGPERAVNISAPPPKAPPVASRTAIQTRVNGKAFSVRANGLPVEAVQILDLQGRVVLQSAQAAASTVTLHLDGVKPGTYLYRVRTAERTLAGIMFLNDHDGGRGN